jgi:hypothetical protein
VPVPIGAKGAEKSSGPEVTAEIISLSLTVCGLYLYIPLPFSLFHPTRRPDPGTPQFTMDLLKSKGSELEESKSAALNQYGDHAHQQKLTRRILLKLDIRLVLTLHLQHSLLIRLSLLPTLALLFLLSFLDRTAVGNLKILGLEKDLSMTDHQYDIGLAVFYLTYICRYVMCHDHHN